MAVRPADLVPGDIVRVVAPSSPFDRVRFDAGVALIEQAGLQVRFDEDIFSAQRFLAGDDERRLREIENALADPHAKALWLARGGYGATRLLPRLDPSRVAQARKWLVGFSDATALHALWARAGVQSVHGANVTTLADWSADAREGLFACLRKPERRRLLGRPCGRKARVRGELIGGNLTLLAAMAGTSFLPRAEHCIVLIEDVGERPYRLDRVVTQLHQCGFFERVAGVIIGQLTDCEEPGAVQSWRAIDVVSEALAPLGVPVVADLPFGHASTSLALALGITAELDGERGELLLFGESL